MTDCTTRLATGADAEALAHVHRWSRASYYGTTADPTDGREQMWGCLARSLPFDRGGAPGCVRGWVDG